MIDVNDLIGRRYELGARGPERYDCWGLLVEIFRRAGVTLPEFDARELSRQDIVRLMREEAQDIVRPTKHPEDLTIAYDLKRGHVGVVLHGRIVHAHGKLGVMSSPRELFRMEYPDTEFFEVFA